MNLLTYYKLKNFPGLLLIIGLMISISTNLPAQKKDQNIEVAGKVSNESGQAVAGAMVYTDQTSASAITGKEGTFTITAAPNDLLFIEAEGFKTLTINVRSLNSGENSITISSLPYKLTEQDEVMLPFGRLKERQIVSAFLWYHCI